MDETRIIAWVDGTLSPEDAAEVAAAVATDPDLAAIADRHRRIRARFTSSFTPLLADPAARPRRRPAQIVSLAAVREERSAPVASVRDARWQTGLWTAAVAASLVIGALAGQAFGGQGIADRNGALALSTSVAYALDRQTSGDVGTVNVAVSFKGHDGRYCRSFVAQYIGGVACKASDGWQLRDAAPVDAEHGDYRMVGGDPASAKVIAAMMAGGPLDASEERKAIEAGWR